ncbi:hypothetical protein LINPERHAP1_LOCUS11818 [Linum perenne]
MKAVEDLVGLGPCFNVSGKDTVAVPDLGFKFKGGAEMKLPATSYFVMVDDGVVCLTIVSDDDVPDGNIIAHVGRRLFWGIISSRIIMLSMIWRWRG